MVADLGNKNCSAAVINFSSWQKRMFLIRPYGYHLHSIDIFGLKAQTVLWWRTCTFFYTAYIRKWPQLSQSYKETTFRSLFWLFQNVLLGLLCCKFISDKSDFRTMLTAEIFVLFYFSLFPEVSEMNSLRVHFHVRQSNSSCRKAFLRTIVNKRQMIMKPDKLVFVMFLLSFLEFTVHKPHWMDFEMCWSKWPHGWIETLLWRYSAVVETWQQRIVHGRVPRQKKITAPSLSTLRMESFLES